MKRIDRFALNFGYVALATLTVALGIRVIVGGAMLGGFQGLVYCLLGVALGTLGVLLPFECWEK